MQRLQQETMHFTSPLIQPHLVSLWHCLEFSLGRYVYNIVFVPLEHVHFNSAEINTGLYLGFYFDL